jgi:hypothetical protein
VRARARSLRLAAARPRASSCARAGPQEQDAFLQSPADAVCITWGDTHIIPFGGQWRYDIHNTNPYLMTRFDNGDRRFRFEVHANQRYGWW